MLRKSAFLDIVSSLMKEENSNLSAKLHTCSPATEVSVPDCDNRLRKTHDSKKRRTKAEKVARDECFELG